MSVRIKVSYTDELELAGVIRLLSPVLKSHKAKKGSKGNHLNAYAVVDNVKLMEFIQKGQCKDACTIFEPERKPEGSREKEQSNTEQRAKPGRTTRDGKKGRNCIRGSPKKETGYY